MLVSFIQTEQGAILAAFFAGYSLTQLVGGKLLSVLISTK